MLRLFSSRIDPNFGKMKVENFIDERGSETVGMKPGRVPSPTSIALAGLTAIAVAMGIGRFAFTPILPMMQEDAGLSVADGGWLASVNYLGFLLGAVSAMGLRLRPTTAIRGGLVVIGMVTLGMGFTSQFIGWIVLRALAGIANAWVQIFVFAWCLKKLAAVRRPLLNGVVFAGVGTGIAIAGGFCLVLMQVNARSAQAWIGLGIISLIATAVIWLIFGPDDEERYAFRGFKEVASTGPRGNTTTDIVWLAMGSRLAKPGALLWSLGLRLHHSRDVSSCHGPAADSRPVGFRLVLAPVRRRGCSCPVGDSGVGATSRQPPSLDSEPSCHGARCGASGIVARYWLHHDRRAPGGFHFHDQCHGQHARSASCRGSRCDGSHGGHDCGLRHRADLRSDLSELCDRSRLGLFSIVVGGEPSADR